MGVSLRYERTNRGRKFSKSKNFQLFSKQVFFKFQDYGIGISFGKKIFDEKNSFKSQYRNEIPKAEITPLCMQSEKGDSPCSDRMARGLEFGCLIAIVRYESTNRGRKFSKSKNFQLFSKQVFFLFRDYGISFGKKFLTKKILSSPSIATKSQRQKLLPFACNQRRGTLPVRIAWQGD